ncbi:uncharacterized protein LOC128983380 [Macrosteles quadrilineatus]|uniref:uncharacterized protein LOC128983260 n=1 Tax=Macrosteles quadrilineatus TaxID=74068 RepID=UPI0023E2AE90|nr:uncharacterized protein LOC128983260 [Macrosteles quadrilineatus]XP_054258614.1 uncharacterized protein LOC128983380 [Macrosteles quadrilineatus]
MMHSWMIPIVLSAVFLQIKETVAPSLGAPGNVYQLSSGSSNGGKDSVLGQSNGNEMEVKRKIIEFLEKKERERHSNCVPNVKLPDNIYVQKQLVRGTNYIFKWTGFNVDFNEVNCGNMNRKENGECSATYNIVEWKPSENKFVHEPSCKEKQQAMTDQK